MEKLGVSPTYLLSQLVNFILLVVLLRILLYRPVMNALEARRQRVARSMADADAAREAATKAQHEYDQRVAEGQRKAQEIIAQATQAAEQVRAEIKAQAAREADEIRQKARQEAAAEKDRIMSDVQAQIASLSMMATERVLGQGVSVDAGLQRKLIDQFLAELGNGGKAVPGGTPAVQDVTP